MQAGSKDVLGRSVQFFMCFAPLPFASKPPFVSITTSSPFSKPPFPWVSWLILPPSLPALELLLRNSAQKGRGETDWTASGRRVLGVVGVDVSYQCERTECHRTVCLEVVKMWFHFTTIKGRKKKRLYRENLSYDWIHESDFLMWNSAGQYSLCK